MKIVLSKNVSERIIKKLKRSGNRETKGALFAKRLDNNCFEIEDVFICKTVGTNSFSNLTINWRYKAFERKYYKKYKYDYLNHNYIGDWHSHPLYDCFPSAYDKCELEDEFARSNATFLIQLIVKMIDDKLVGRCYFISKTTRVKECVLEIL